MQRFTAALLRHRLLVVLVWVALTVVGGLMVGKATKGMSHLYATPGLAGYDTNQAMKKQLGIDGGEAPVIAVLKMPAGQSMNAAAGRKLAADAFSEAARLAGHVALIDYATSHDQRLISSDGRTTWAFYDVPNPDKGVYRNTEASLTPALAKANPPGARMTVTGNEALQNAGASGGGLSTLTETLIGGAAALVVLAFVYGSALAVMPILMALPSILVAFLAMYGLEQAVSVSSLEQYLVAFIGLGVAADYSLLIVTRWREERDLGLDNHAAILAANRHAGGAVLLSGFTVGLGMLALLIIPVQFLQDIGLGSLLIPVVSMLTAVTLLPVLLSAWGPALDKHRLRKGSTYSHSWERWTSRVVDHKFIAAAVGLVVVVALAVPALSMNTGSPNANALGHNGAAAQAFHEMERRGVPQAATFPIQLLVHGDANNARAAARTAGQTGGVWAVYQPKMPSGIAANTTMLTVIPTQPGNTSAGTDTVARLRHAFQGSSGKVQVGGDTAANLDFTNAIYNRFPLALALIALITFALLARSFRSVPLALKAVVLNLISLGASFGFLVVFWQSGHGSNLIYGIQALHSVKNWAPIIMFAFLFGISMDYEVFVLARMREEYDNTGDTRKAIVSSLSHTGRLVTSAALILGISFASLSTTHDAAVQVPATGLAVGVIVDAVIVRTLLVPAIAAMLGDWNWWMPAGLARLLRSPSPPISKHRTADVVGTGG